MEIYIDASGDPGLSDRAITAGVSTPYYCLGVIALREMEPATIIDKARREFFDTYGKQLPKEIKYVKASPEARKILVKHLCGDGIQKYVLSLNKLDRHTRKVSEFSEAGITPFVMQRNILSTMMEMLFQGDAILTSSDEKIDVYFDEGTHEHYAKTLERQVRRYKQEIRPTNLKNPQTIRAFSSLIYLPEHIITMR